MRRKVRLSHEPDMLKGPLGYRYALFQALAHPRLAGSRYFLRLAWSGAPIWSAVSRILGRRFA